MVANDLAKNAFYNQLHLVIQQVPPHDISIVLADFNATSSSDSRGSQTGNIVGPQSPDSAKQEAYPLDTLFPRKNIYKWTWYSPNGRTRKALDHILISSQWKSSITNCRVYRRDQLGNTDHRLLIGQLRLKLKVTTPKWVQPQLRASHLLPQGNIVARLRSTAIYVTIYEQTEKKYRI